MGASVFISAVGAAAPTLRIGAADVGAAWGRKGGRASSAVCAPDEDTLTLAAGAAVHALETAGIDLRTLLPAPSCCVPLTMVLSSEMLQNELHEPHLTISL